jgi:hypothetical protein
VQLVVDIVHLALEPLPLLLETVPLATNLLQPPAALLEVLGFLRGAGARQEC